MAEVKICGITTAEALDAALDGGARFAGFVLFPKSPRHVARDRAEALISRARGRAQSVIVAVDPDDALLAWIGGALQPDWIQLHGRESPQRVAEAGGIARARTIKAIGLARADDLAQAAAYASAADMLLFDAKPPPGGLPGGNALAFDWAILAGRSFSRPWLLSGGLTPANVGEAVRTSGAAYVDVSSGVESAPGLKDPTLIAQFLAAAQA
jgi:phosphoribosylanthranilate isomerase